MGKIEERYARMVSEVVGYMDSAALKSAMSEPRKSVRVDMLLGILRVAFRCSSFGVYNGVLHYFGGRIYEPVCMDEFADVVYEIMRHVGLPDGDYSRVEGMIKVCRRVVLSKQLEISRGYMVFRNCVYDIRRGVCVDFSREYVQFSYADYDYNVDALGVMWGSFLNEVLPNRVHQMILQEFLGSLFVDRSDAKMETMLILKGNGANGKSVIFDTVVGLLGKENVSSFGLDALVGGGTERKRNIASMNGKRLNYASESGLFTIDGSSGLLKALISGEPVEARAMYGENFTARDIPPIMINTNHMPKMKDFSNGMRRRLCIIPFEVEIPKDKQDKELSNKLRIEYPYIFNWVLAGRKRYIEHGYRFTRSHIVDEALEEYMYMNSSVLAFMGTSGYENRETVMDEKPFWFPIADLYQEYVSWCRRNAEEIEGKRKFSLHLIEAGYRRATINNCVSYAVYGGGAIDAALNEVRSQRKEVERRAEEDKRAYSEIRERVRRDMGWSRLAVGADELRVYLGYRVDVEAQMRNGYLDGCYTRVGKVVVFNLELVDTLWRPGYEERARDMARRLEKRHERIRLMDDYRRASVDDTLSIENTGVATQQQREW